MEAVEKRKWGMSKHESVSIEIRTRRTNCFVDVQIVSDNATIYLGLLSDSERDELAKTLLEALWGIGPNEGCLVWLASIFEKCQIDIPSEVKHGTV